MSSRKLESGSSSGERRLVPLTCLLLAALIVAAFWHVIGHDFINYDDDDYVTANLHIRRIDIPWALTTFREANWHPLTWLSHMLDWRIYGPNAGGHHATNLILHAASTILLFLLLHRMTGFVWRSAFVAALFGIHPLHVESVAWVAERKDVLSALFWMLTMLAYVRYAERPGIGRYIPIFVLFALGLMVKPMLVTLPFVLLIIDWWPLGRFRSPRVIQEKLPLIGLAATSGVITFIAQHGGLAVGSLDQYPVGVRVANALVAYTAYLVKTVYPVGLSVFYPHPGDTLPVWQVIGSAALLVGITALVVRSARTRPWLAAGWFWYLITLLPVIGLVQVGMQAMADRYTYVPLVGVFMAIAYGSVGVRGSGTGKKIPTRPHPHTPILACLIIAALMPLTWRQVGYWRDSETLFRHALSVTRNNAVAENNLGLALVERDRLDEGIRRHRCAIEIKPGWADAHYSLGAALLKNGEPYEAMSEFEKVLALDPNHAPAHNNLAAALMDLGDLPRAIDHLRRAVDIRPDYAQAHNNLGTAYYHQTRWDEAVREWTTAVRLDPSLADAHYNLAFGLGNVGRYRDAVEECRKALALRPDWVEAQNNLAWFLVANRDRTSRDVEEAIRLAEQACRATGGTNPNHLDTLAEAYEAAGRRDDAERVARKARALAEK